VADTDEHTEDEIGLGRGMAAQVDVLADNDLIAFGLMQQLAAPGLTVGVDVSVIGFDDIWLAPVLTPALTTIRVPGAEAGAAAVRLLVRLMAEGVPDPAPTQRLPTELIVRATTGAARR
jgi:DNA-binding LacI/PurR family transcriptional regulator